MAHDLSNEPIAALREPEHVLRRAFNGSSPADERAAVLEGFLMRFLPARGWRRVLVVGADAAEEALFLARRGYDVTIASVRESERLAVQERFSAADVRAGFVLLDPDRPLFFESFDVVVCSRQIRSLDTFRAINAALTTALRMHGVVLFGSPARGLVPDRSGVSQALVLRRGTRLGRLTAWLRRTVESTRRRRVARFDRPSTSA